MLSSSETRDWALIGGAAAAVLAGGAAVAVAGVAVTSWLKRRSEKQAAAAAAYRQPSSPSQRIPWHDHKAWAAQSDLEPELVAAILEAYESGWPKEEPGADDLAEVSREAPGADDPPVDIEAAHVEQADVEAQHEAPRADDRDDTTTEQADAAELGLEQTEDQARDRRPAAAPRRRLRPRSPRTRYPIPKRPAVVSAPPVDQVDPDGPTPRAAGPPPSHRPHHN
ncbi:MAG: hypothetical protein KC431_29485 [Myxococcales bacterium]|nr:hypothetical protein [Myxococcales bacterium]